ncbi:deoxyribodipyrimidine photo-lyase [Entomohabitans teleogrylli]|uniref:deoxyribodipyrimidine photo-lyase n=1 Tax=Entomohabitans teleogrylli TaxID=1384589 RepID=UPI00073D6098|nr:deoxyribodipyrimidine photo-lyase [Entomohabitans teleogrylli]
MATHLVWLRNDLRLHDNPALSAACRDPQARVLALYIATPAQWRSHEMAPRQAAFIQRNLQHLHHELAQRNIPLYSYQTADFSTAVSDIALFCRQHHVDALFYNYQYELNEQRRDAALEKALARTVVCQGFHDSVILPPGSVTTGNQEMYRVFTPFSKAFLRRLQEGIADCLPAPARRHASAGPTPPPAPFDYPQEAVDEALFPAGEAAAIERLRRFCRNQAQDYEVERDFPDRQGTSLLSPYLATGVLSPQQCLHRLLREQPGALLGQAGSIWLNELIWREFYRHLLVAYPRLCCHQPFQPWTDRVAWRNDEAQLTAWQQGRTGFPIVDAAMRQLNQTGWMHNRLRMIVASFLVKDLLIDWRLGERYFMSRLIDGDLAANNGGWQWAASTGTDAAPYFRIFNPTTQGERFDPDGAFIRQWIPALRHIPGKAIHQPWVWADKRGETLDWPRPIVDHQQARNATLKAYEAARHNAR